MALFNESSEASDSHRDQAALSKLTDALRDRFGDDAVSYGRDLRFRDHTTGTAPMGKNDV
jgi:DNA polymerase-4